MATSVAPVCMVLLLLLGGFYVNTANIPAAWRWVSQLSFVRYYVTSSYVLCHIIMHALALFIQVHITIYRYIDTCFYVWLNIYTHTSMALGVCRSSLLSVSYVSLLLGTYNYTDVLILVCTCNCIHTYNVYTHTSPHAHRKHPGCVALGVAALFC